MSSFRGDCAMKQSFFLICFVITTLVSAAHAAEPRPYSVAIIPRSPTAVLAREWQPFMTRLAADVGHPFNLKFHESYEAFESDLLGGHFDIAYVNPYQAAIVRDRGYIPLVKDSSKLIGVLVVRKDSGLAGLADLNGRTIAFPAPGAFVASWYLQALLTHKEKIRFTPKYAKTHANVYRTVLLKLADAGGGALTTLNEEPENLRSLLAILYQTPATASHPIVVHQRVPADIRKRLQAAIMAMAGDDEGLKLLRGINMPFPVAADYKTDYSPLLQLRPIVETRSQDKEKGPTEADDAELVRP